MEGDTFTVVLGQPSDTAGEEPPVDESVTITTSASTSESIPHVAAADASDEGLKARKLRFAHPAKSNNSSRIRMVTPRRPKADEHAQQHSLTPDASVLEEEDRDEGKQSVSSGSSRQSISMVLRRNIEREATKLDPGLIKLKSSLLWILLLIAVVNVAAAIATRVLLRTHLGYVDNVSEASKRQRFHGIVLRDIAELRLHGQVSCAA